jgi:hypothetical protein
VDDGVEVQVKISCESARRHSFKAFLQQPGPSTVLLLTDSTDKLNNCMLESDDAISLFVEFSTTRQRVNVQL